MCLLLAVGGEITYDVFPVIGIEQRYFMWDMDAGICLLIVNKYSAFSE